MIQKMDPAIKALWLKALRSKEFPQTTRALKDEVGYCCLGVLCELHARETGTEWVWTSSNLYAYGQNTSTLPDSVILWSGVQDQNPDVTNGCLAQLNDGDERNSIKAHTFTEIADIIERDL